MPRVHFVKKARRDNPVAKRGESYYWWKFRYGGKRYSLTPPKQSQLTQSAYFGTLYDLQDSVANADVSDADSLESIKDEAISELENLRDECQEKLDNMPESLQYSPTGELLQERIDACESAISDIQNVDEYGEEEPSQSDFDNVSECSECDGTGHIDDDEDEECPACGGTGEEEDLDEFETALAEWQSNSDQHYETAKEEISDAISNCIV